IPGGLCRPDSCAASEGEVCSRGWHCTYTAYSRYVCALDGDDVFASSGCSSVRKPSFPVMGLLFLLGLAPLVRRRGEQNPRRR
ncbi:MAG: MYXO-CTERM sorting domain-containing protein, partial [Myxococcota bacterium]